MKTLKEARVWLACKVLGDISLIHKVKFYQTICLDIDGCINIEGCTINRGHNIEPRLDVGIKFDYYEDSINGTYEDRIKSDLICDFK